VQREEKTGMKGMPEGMRVLIANEPLAYREVISAAFKELRPHLEIYVVEPAELDKELLRLSPRFVVCSRRTELIEQEAFAWVELYPQHTSGAVVNLAGKKTIFKEMDFDTLLSILDDTQHLYESV
jgi:hypothetical protein